MSLVQRFPSLRQISRTRIRYSDCRQPRDRRTFTAITQRRNHIRLGQTVPRQPAAATVPGRLNTSEDRRGILRPRSAAIALCRRAKSTTLETSFERLVQAGGRPHGNNIHSRLPLPHRPQYARGSPHRHRRIARQRTAIAVAIAPQPSIHQLCGMETVRRHRMVKALDFVKIVGCIMKHALPFCHDRSPQVHR